MTATSSDLEENVREVVKAFNIPGNHPRYHFYQQARLAEEWPALYNAILRLVRDYHD